MSTNKSWDLQGVFYECCRMEGQCPYAFGRDTWGDPCTNIGTYEIKKGHIGSVDMKGILMIAHQTAISPRFADLSWDKKGGIEAGAWYITEKATEEQRKILEPFVIDHFGAQRWKECLGVKFVKINIAEENGTYHITMPYGEQILVPTVGGDGKNPIYLGNPIVGKGFFTDTKIYYGKVWRWSDYGRISDHHNTSGVVANFNYKGQLA
jgi:hypothetical protein